MFIEAIVELSLIPFFADRRLAVKIIVVFAEFAQPHCSMVTSQIRGAVLNLSVPFYFLIA